LVAGSFGRGIYILDDYSVLREISEEQLNKEASLFSTRKAWWYLPQTLMDGDNSMQGHGYFTAPNPPFGAVFTYYLNKDYKTLKAIRQEKEKELTKQNKDIPFPGWDMVEKERNQPDPKVWLTVKDAQGNVVRRIEGPIKKGFHRIAWDLRYPKTDAIDINKIDNTNNGGILAAPGKYSVSLSKQIDGVVTELSLPVEFTVEALRNGSLKGASAEELFAFSKEVVKLQGAVGALSLTLGKALKKIDAMQHALSRAAISPGKLDSQLYAVKSALQVLDGQLNGNKSKDMIGEKDYPTVYNRLFVARMGISYSTYGPTPTHKRSLELANKQFGTIKTELEKQINIEIPKLEKLLIEADAPWIEGQPLR